jgi:hypothetical protein
VTVLLAVICAVLMLAGFAGLFLPVLPGIQLAWAGFLIYAWGTGFERISLPVTIFFTVLMLISWALDYVAQAIGARKFKASRYGVIGAFIGGILGIFILNIWGAIFGPFIGALAGELLAKRGLRRAFASAGGTFVGCLAGNLFKLVIMLAMAGFFIATLF